MTANKAQIKVLLVDDKELFRKGLAKPLEEQPLIEVVCQCDNGSKAEEKAKEIKPDVVLMDVHIAECDGIKVAQHINESLPKTKVAMLTDSEQGERLFSSLKAVE